MKRPRMITGIAMAVAVFLLLGTGVALAYGTGYRSGWCWGPGAGQSPATAAAQYYPDGTPTQASTAGITAQPTQVVPPCPGPGWCWDAATRSWTPPAASGTTTAPQSSPQGTSPYRGSYCSGSGCCW